MVIPVKAVAIGLALALAGCGGGGGGGGGGGYGGGDNNGGNNNGGNNPPAETPFTPGTTQATALGLVLADDNGMTLYTFENDRNDTGGDGDGDSDCNGDCATNWPPVIASATDTATGLFGIITRDDGSTLQWTFKGLPLYHYVGDTAAGDTSGEGLNDIWFVARPDPWTTTDTALGTVFAGVGDLLDEDGSGAQSTTRVDRQNFTLYTFENDRNDTDSDGTGDSDCNGTCAHNWPPLYAEAGATDWGDFTVIERDDGTRQWAFKGLPLYFYIGDAAAGDTNGDGIGDIWSVARPDPFTTADSSIGTVFAGATSVLGVDGTGAQTATRVDRNGFTLYVFDNDVNDTDSDGSGDSDCNGGCASFWPPLYADNGATAGGNFTIIDRDDGTRQWAFKGEPLYFFANDAAAGDVNGDQVNTVWHAARPAPVQLFDAAATLGDIFAARGTIADVDGSGNRAATSSDKTGFTVYLFDNDASDTDGDGAGDSDCNGTCAVTWPPLYAETTDTAAGDFTIIDRDDGSKQWAYKGAPLYFFHGDAAAGDTNGIYGTWHEVTP
jgi:predicted lipoprotein with Yx(FWY)xxD motif